MKRILIWVVGLVAFVGSLWIGWTFRSNNSQVLDIDLIWIHVPQIESWWLVLVAMSIGAMLAGAIIGFAWLRARLLLRKVRSRLRRLEKEVHELRSLPLIGSEPGGSTIDQGRKRGPATSRLPVAERG